MFFYVNLVNVIMGQFITPLIIVNRTVEFFMLTPYICNLHRAEFMHSFVKGLNSYFKDIRSLKNVQQLPLISVQTAVSCRSSLHCESLSLIFRSDNGVNSKHS